MYFTILFKITGRHAADNIISINHSRPGSQDKSEYPCRIHFAGIAKIPEHPAGPGGILCLVTGTVDIHLGYGNFSAAYNIHNYRLTAGFCRRNNPGFIILALGKSGIQFLGRDRKSVV